MDAVEAYRKRREARLKARMDHLRWDDEEGKWITTDNGHKVHLSEDGQPDKGNPHVLNAISGKKKEDNIAEYSRKEPETMEGDMEKQGYKKNSEGRWEKTNDGLYPEATKRPLEIDHKTAKILAREAGLKTDDFEKRVKNGEYSEEDISDLYDKSIKRLKIWKIT